MRVPGGVCRGVLDEIDEHLGQQFPVAPNDEPVLDPAVRLCSDPRRGRRRARRSPSAKPRSTGAKRARAVPAVSAAQHGGEGLQNFVGVADDRIDELPVLLDVAGRPRNLQSLAKARQRRAQVMGNVGGTWRRPSMRRGSGPASRSGSPTAGRIISRASGGMRARSPATIAWA
jgi:hypothetical protein